MASLRQMRCTLLIPSCSEEGTWGFIPTPEHNKDVFVSITKKGIQLSFPRDVDRSIWTWYSPDLEMTDSNMLHITIELPPKGFGAELRPFTSDDSKTFGVEVLGELKCTQILTLTVDENSKSEVIGYGTPFHGTNSVVDGWVNQGTQICGVASLIQILLSTNITLLVQGPLSCVQEFVQSFKTSKKPEAFGYGDVHTWDMKRFALQQRTPKLIGRAFEPRIRFENANERDTALTQIHRVGEEPAEKTKQFVCLIEPTKEFQGRHWRAARRALRGDASKLWVSFKYSKGQAWEAVHLTFATSDHLAGVDCKRRLPLLLTRPDEKQPDYTFCPVSHPNYKTAKTTTERNIVALQWRLSLHNEERRVFAINRLSSLEVSPSLMAKDSYAFIKQAVFNELLVGKGLWSLQKQDINIQLPPFDLFDGIPAEIQVACLDHVFEDDRKRVEQYFGKLHLGLGLVSGPPGTGKSQLAAILVVLMCFNDSIQQVYVAAASNGATDNILDRIDGMAQKVSERLQGDFKQLMVLRGYSLSIEVDNCTQALLDMPFKKDTIWNPSPWRPRLSLCWWTLRTMGAKGVPPLTVYDNAELWELHQNLNKLITSPSSNSDLSKFQQVMKLARGIEPRESYTRLLTQEDHRKVLSKLMGLVVECANVVATTPGTSDSWIYQRFNDTKARAVIFDEAATMFCSDALLVYGNTPRPMIAIGDPKQLAPSLATAFELRYGSRVRHDRYDGPRASGRDLIPTNRFAPSAQISWLSWLIHLGWPVFHLYTQHRMAEGLFDLSLDTVYQSLKPHFKYSPLCKPVNFSLGLKIEDYLTAKYHIPSDNTLRPVFFHCEACPCREWKDSLSRLNPRQADVIAQFLAKMIVTLNLPPKDIVVLTPYRANMGAIGRTFRKENVLNDVKFSTFNRFQGQEAQIVVLAMCVDQETGPLFVADKRSLNVALTRQRSSLLIFGDIRTTSYSKDRLCSENPEPRIDQTMIKRVFEKIDKSRRVVTLRGNMNLDPDHFWDNQ
ncbi:hypothetical protein FIE12Z_5228 [Fusarium flagelliforme]|uniref:DNA2/NAM7 helicase-like C-terminal domain-containing protein n=1 Tax=Fusarium flagelliforme TaxID=2675880 RepID=A0A395MSB5_9HYPO|nr:hypothetical protein FIE12Z_5228 [Fusarium flagelliforme]